jgi:hypothetical protein
MSESTEKEFFTQKHARLTNIASTANIFSWIALVSQILYMGVRFIQLQNSYLIQTMMTGIAEPNFMAMLSQNAVYLFGFIIDLASIFLRGVVFWLVLKGISLGLYMIVETDLNYKARSVGGDNE